MTDYIVEILSDDATPDISLTADVLDLRWRLGMAKPYDDIATTATAQITLHNPNGRYTPGNGTTDYGRTLRIRSDDGMTVRTHYVGSVVQVEPASGEYGPETIVVKAAGPLATLRENRVRLRAILDTCADEVVAAVVGAVPTRPRTLTDSFIVANTDHGILGVNSTLSPDAALVGLQLDAGVSEFAFVGDNWEDGVAALDAVREVVAAERGRFYTNRDGDLVLLNRRATLERRTPVAAFDNNMDGLALTYGEDAVSRVSVTLRPRRLGGPNDVLWTLGASQLIPARAVVQFVAPFRGGPSERIGALWVNRPVPNEDYTATDGPSGGGLNRTGTVEMRVVRADGAAALVEVINAGNTDAYLLGGAVLRGYALFTGDPITVEAEDAASRAVNGPRDLTLSLPALTSVTEGQDIANYELTRRREPRLRAMSLELRSIAAREQVLTRTLFDRITVTDSGTGYDTDVFIVAEAHHVSGGGAVHHVTWTLEPTNPGAFWVVGDGALDTDTRLTY